MSRCLILLLWTVTLSCCFSYYFVNGMDLEDNMQDANEEDSSLDAQESGIGNDIEDIIDRIEELAARAEKTVKEGILPIENTEQVYAKMQEGIEELLDLTSEAINIYKFLNAKGIERVILPNFGVHYEPLKRQLLLLIKNLFDVAPISTKAVIPIGVVDKVLDIFEYDNLALKAHALDVLYAWLPDNPKVQTRVIKMKGLEPFYNQVAKLDVGVIDQLLDLFNIILEEHIKARKKDMQRNKADHDRLIMYQRIGLIERLSTPNVCNGLLKILETTWSFNAAEKEISLPILKLIKNVIPYCINIYKAKPKYTNIFQELLKYISEPNRINNLEKLGLNVTDTYVMLKELSYIFNNALIKDEF